MAKHTKSNIGLSLLGVFALFFAFFIEIRLGFSALAAICIWVFFYMRPRRPTVTQAPKVQQQTPQSTPGSSGLAIAITYSHQMNASKGDEPELVTTPADSLGASTGFRIPPAPSSASDGAYKPINRQFGIAGAMPSFYRYMPSHVAKTPSTSAWIPRGQQFEISGIKIHGGMVYFGTSLKTSSDQNDPCLIDPSKAVASHADQTAFNLSYYSSYSSISLVARRAYLTWLATGRMDPEVDIGFVFLFFYGLERRVIVDRATDETARSDAPTIADELRRLLDIYAEKSQSFRLHATDLLDWISHSQYPAIAKLYSQPLPSFEKTFELPFHVRLALGQAALDAAAVPAGLALAWLKLNPNIELRTPALRCAEQFDQLFTAKYVETFADGMVLPRNRTKLKFVYRPASFSLQRQAAINLSFGDTPDVSVLTAPIKKLLLIAETATKELEPYSRFIGKNPDFKNRT